MNEKDQIKKEIQQNKLVKFIEDDLYEPLSIKVKNKRRDRLNLCLRFFALALIFESLGTLLDIYASSSYIFLGLSESMLLFVRSALGIGSLILIIIAFAYLIGATRSKIMKDIRNDELL